MLAKRACVEPMPDRMPRPTAVQSTEVAVVTPRLRKCCGTCAGWSPIAVTPFWGECQASRPGSNGPRPTTDLTVCSAHQWKADLA